MFTNDWFNITARVNFEKYINPSKKINMLEVGCYEGQASYWLMEHTTPDSLLTVVDTFDGSADLPNEENLVQRFMENTEKYKDRIEVSVGFSCDRLKDLNGMLFDFIYIDASHTAADTMEDMVLAFPLLDDGGIMIIDDYTWGDQMDFYNIPRPGINAFLTVYGNQLDVLEKNSQVVLRKK